MSKQENKLDWGSKADELAAALEPYYKGKKEVLNGISKIENVIQNSSYAGTETEIGESKYLRVLKCTDRYVRCLITSDAKTYPGEQALAPKSLISGYRISFDQMGDKVELTSIERCNVDKTRAKGFEFVFEDRIKELPTIDTDPITATLFWLPRLKPIFDILH